MATADTSDLRASLLEWANRGAGQALVNLGQSVRDKAPYGAGENARIDGAPHLVDTLETIVTSEGETWTGEIAFTAEHASYVNDGTSPHQIVGNPLLAFQWEGQTVIVHSVNHPGTTANPFFSDGVTEETWANELDQALTGEAF